MRFRSKVIAASLVTATMIAAGGVAYAETTNPSPSPAGAASHQKVRTGAPGALLRRVVRGDVEVLGKDGKIVKVHIERGKVSDVTDAQFTLTGPDGHKATVKTNADTKFRPKTVKLSDLDGRGVVVLSQKKDGDAYVASAVLARRVPKRAAAGQQQPDTPAPDGF